MGLGTFMDRRIASVILVASAVFGLATSWPNIDTQRSQAFQVAQVLAQAGKPGDIVAYCPDQLGPDSSRLLPSGKYDEITFPRGTGPQFVDWVDYAKVVAEASPAGLRKAPRADERTGSPDLVRLGSRLPDLRRGLPGRSSRPARRHQARGEESSPRGPITSRRAGGVRYRKRLNRHNPWTQALSQRLQPTRPFRYGKTARPVRALRATGARPSSVDSRLAFGLGRTRRPS